MIGNFKHPPNVDSVLWARGLWTRIRARIELELDRRERATEGTESGQREDVHCIVYGAFATPQHTALTDKDNGFYVRGLVKDQYAALESARVLFAPLRFGAGIKGKIADAWSVGLPVVTTSIGAEGMELEALEHEWRFPNNTHPAFAGLVSDEDEHIIEAASSLYLDQCLWEEVQRRGYTALRALFDKKANAERLMSEVEVMLVDVESRRRNDWAQALLWGTALRASEHQSTVVDLKRQLRQERRARQVCVNT